MQYSVKQISAWSAIAGMSIVTVLLCSYLFMQKSSVADSSDVFTEDTSDFEKAEHYFSAEYYDLEKARQYYTASIRANPTANVLQWYQLARIDFIQGDFESALHNLDKQYEYFGEQVPNINYTYGLVYGFRGDLLNREQDFRLAEKHFLKFLEYMPDSPWARVDLSWIYFSLREFSNMIAILQPIYDDQQNNPWVLNMYGLALLNTGQTQEAVDHLTRANELVAEVEAQEWGEVYPGNSPTDWEIGVAEFRKAVQMNLELAKKRLQESGDNDGNNT
jgi:tetratricopeptide (TPR) repeat protein